jgi:hypothetical protein
VEGRALRDTIKPEELIEGEAQSDENFDVEFGQRLRGGGGDVGV